MKTKPKRFIENAYDLNNININDYRNLILKQIEKLELEFDLKCPPKTNKAINSLGKQEDDISFYTGTGGNIYLYWRQYLFYKKDKNYFKKFTIALETNLNILNKSGGTIDSNSFLMGDSGIYLFCCIYGIETKNEQYFKEYFNKLIELKNLEKNNELELELLYGITGYLYSLLFLKKYLLSINKLQKYPNEEKLLDEIIRDLFFEIIKKGIENMNQYNWKKCLVYPFPLNDKYSDLYLGAAHGLIGIMYLLLCTIKIYPNILNYDCKNIKYLKKNNLKNIIIENLNYIKSLQIKSTGNFPDDVKGKDSGEKVHFCHGCVGAVHLFLLAEELFPNHDYKAVSIKSNNCLWEKGLLYKGNGVCHGMAGTCYPLMKLYQFTKNEVFLKEAIGVAYATFDPKIQSLVSEFSDPQRKVKGIADHPYSLMEGNGGLLIMYYDLISLIDEDKDCMTKLLPGYEIC